MVVEIVSQSSPDQKLHKTYYKAGNDTYESLDDLARDHGELGDLDSPQWRGVIFMYNHKTIPFEKVVELSLY